MNATRITAAAFGALLATAATVAAAPPEGPRGAHGPGGFGSIEFAAIDTDGDGALSRAELQARAADRLARLDLDGDGALDRAELIAAFPGRGGAFAVFSVDPAEAMADRILAAAGATAAGQVEVATLAEAQVNRLFVRLDASRDDVISAEEAADARHERHGMRRRGGPDAGDR